mgnify:CR=1 FL=1
MTLSVKVIIMKLPKILIQKICIGKKSLHRPLLAILRDLLSQLKVGGRMVIPVGDDTQKMVFITKTSENDIEQKVLGDFSFVPLLRKKSQ